MTIRKVTKPVATSSGPAPPKPWEITINPDDAENNMVKDADNFWCCKICPHKQKQKGNVKAHVIARHGPDMRLPCPYCKKLNKNKWALNAHVYRNHITLLDEYESK